MIVNRKYITVKRYLRGISVLLFFILVPGNIFSASLNLSSVMENVQVDSNLSYIEDKAGNLTIDDIINTDPSVFNNLEKNNINMGF